MDVKEIIEKRNNVKLLEVENVYGTIGSIGHFKINNYLIEEIIQKGFRSDTYVAGYRVYDIKNDKIVTYYLID